MDKDELIEFIFDRIQTIDEIMEGLEYERECIMKGLQRIIDERNRAVDKLAATLVA